MHEPWSKNGRHAVLFYSSLYRGVVAAADSSANSSKETAEGVARQVASNFQLQLAETYTPTLVVAEFVRDNPNVPYQLSIFPTVAEDILNTQVVRFGNRRVSFLTTIVDMKLD